jgi:hypothetical protein
MQLPSVGAKNSRVRTDKLLPVDEPHEYPRVGPGPLKEISDDGSTTTNMCHRRRRKRRSYDMKKMRKEAVSVSGGFQRRQRRRESLATVSNEACYETQEFFNIKSKNILDEKSDMEKLTWKGLQK